MSTIIPDGATFEEVGQILTQALLRVPALELPSAVGWLSRLQATAQMRMLQGQTLTVSAPEDLLTMAEAAKRLSIPETRAYELARKGKLPAVKIGKYVRVSAQALVDYQACLPKA